jgi:RNA polymerase sigma-70 factor (ECF subfamily)
MSDDPTFRDLIQRVRQGDGQAATELVRIYEPTIRMVIRRRLTDTSLRRLFDSMDVCQSVLASFFVRAASGQFELDRPEQLLKLLATMARNKLANEVHKYKAARRSPPGPQGGDAAAGLVTSNEPSPSTAVANRELLQEFQRRLSDEERWLVDQRSLGRGWAEIAAEVGGSPDGLRMRYTRAIDRVSRELGLEN